MKITIKKIYKINYVLKMTNEEIRRYWNNYDDEYAEDCIIYKESLNSMLKVYKDYRNHVILVNIHVDFPQGIGDHYILDKDSVHCSKLLNTDDYNIVVDIDDYREYLKEKNGI